MLKLVDYMGVIEPAIEGDWGNELGNRPSDLERGCDYLD